MRRHRHGESTGTGERLWSSRGVFNNLPLYTGGVFGWPFYNFMTGGLSCVNVPLVSGRRVDFSDGCWGLEAGGFCGPRETPAPFLLCLLTSIVKMGLVHSLGWTTWGYRKPESLLTLCGSSWLSQPAGKLWFSPLPCFHFICCFPLVPTGWAGGCVNAGGFILPKALRNPQQPIKRLLIIYWVLCVVWLISGWHLWPSLL